MDINIWEIVALALNGETLTEEEREELDAWLAEGEHRKEFGKLADFYRSNQGKASELADAEQGWKENCRRRAERRKKRVWRALLKVGTAALVAVAIGGAFLLLERGKRTVVPEISVVQAVIEPGSPKAVLTLASGKEVHLEGEVSFEEMDSSRMRNENNTLEYVAKGRQERKKELEYNMLSIPRGGEYRLKLEDGTMVWINSDTRLRYPVAFGEGERRVFLEGEAYFEVAKDAGRPFTVCVNGTDVTALGTAFNVSAVRDKGEVYTTLVEGAVRVKNEEGEGCVLEPSQQAVCRKGEERIAVRTVNTALYTSWKDGYYAFEGQTLEEIMYTLSRWYNVEVVFENREAAGVRYSGRLRRYEEVGNFLAMMALTHDVEFIVRERTITVKQKGK